MSDDIDYDALLADAPSPEHIQIVAFEGLQYGLIDVEQYTAMHEAIRALRASVAELEAKVAVQDRLQLPAGSIVVRWFDFDSNTQEHIPKITISLPRVAAFGDGFGLQRSWGQRDKIAAMLAAAQQPAGGAE